MTLDYEEISAEDELAAVSVRLRNLELQHLQLSLRANTTGVNELFSDQDQTNLDKLEESIKTLQERKAALAPSAD